MVESRDPGPISKVNLSGFTKSKVLHGNRIKAVGGFNVTLFKSFDPNQHTSVTMRFSTPAMALASYNSIRTAKNFDIMFEQYLNKTQTIYGIPKTAVYATTALVGAGLLSAYAYSRFKAEKESRAYLETLPSTGRYGLPTRKMR